VNGPGGTLERFRGERQGPVWVPHDETLGRLVSLLESRAIEVGAVIPPHAGESGPVGATMLTKAALDRQLVKPFFRELWWCCRRGC